MNIKSWSFLGVIILSVLLVFSGFILQQIYLFDFGTQQDIKNYSIFLNKYKITRSKNWYNTFQKQIQKHHTVSFVQKGSQLLIDSKYLAEIGYTDENYEEQTITDVLEISSKLNKKIHFVVRSQGHQQVYYLPNEQKIQSKDNKHKLEKCFQLNEVQLTDKLHYFVDKSDYFWIVSHPHNNILFIQVYDCQNQKLVKKIFHQPNFNNRAFMINELIKIQVSSNGNYLVKLLTYESHEYGVEIGAKQYQTVSMDLIPSYEIQSQKINIDSESSSSISYRFLDPLNRIFQRQFYYLLFKTIQKYMAQVKNLLGTFGVDAKQLNSFLKEKIKQYEKQKYPEYFDYDLQLFDFNNNCVLNLQYHLENHNQHNSSLTRLSKYLLDTKTPVFHSVQNYDQYDILQVLKNQKIPQVSEFKRISIDQGFQKEYTSNYFYSIYHTYPDSKIHFLGVGQKTFYLHPSEAVKSDEYLTVRTHTGGIVMQGTKIKGVYEDKPLTEGQIRQNYFVEANQVIPGIWQAHAGYQALISILNGNRVQLINGLSGKIMVTYDINAKKGYQYENSFLFNNQWWIVVFNKNTRMSEVVKHQLYVQKDYPKQIDFVRRTYGKLVDSEFDESEDDLLQVFKEYSSQVSSNGIIVLDIFRCIDEYYYIKLCDTNGQNYAIARIHFKRFSNRLPKLSTVYSSDLEKRLIVEPKKMVKQTQSIDPFLFVLEGAHFYEGISDLIKEGNFNFKNYTTKNNKKNINSLKKINQFQFLPYTVISHQQTQQIPSQQAISVQQITLLNMRVLVENAKKKFMIETKILARNRLMYFIVFVIIILFSSIVKLLIQNDLKKIQNSHEKQNMDKNEQQESNSPQKGKKKQKSN